MNGSKFLGICIVISFAILAAAVIFHARRDPAIAQPKASAPASQIGRCQFAPSNSPGVIWVIDTTTGKVRAQSG